MRPVSAMLAKDVLVTCRTPLFAIISILVPVAFTFLYAIVVHVSTTATIAIADEDRTSQSRQLVQVMTELRNDDGYFYEIRTTDPERARELYASGDVGAVLTIPRGFAAEFERGGSPHISLLVFNINADGTKNQHLRIEGALRAFNAAAIPDGGRLQIDEESAFGRDIPVSVYLGSALILFAALYSGIVNTGVAIAREWEDRTAKSLVLSPAGRGPFLAGKWLSSLAISVFTIGCAALSVGAVLGFPLTRLGPLALLSIATAWMYGAALGALLGITLRKSLPLIPLGVLLAVGHFLASGYESYVRGFAHGGIVEAFWRSVQWIPLNQLFDAIRFEVAGLAPPPGIGWGLTGSISIAIVVAAVAASRFSRTGTFAQGQ